MVKNEDNKTDRREDGTVKPRHMKFSYGDRMCVHGSTNSAAPMGNCGATDKCQGTHYGTIEHLVPATSNTISTCTLSLVEFAPWLRIKTETLYHTIHLIDCRYKTGHGEDGTMLSHYA